MTTNHIIKSITLKDGSTLEIETWNDSHSEFHYHHKKSGYVPKFAISYHPITQATLIEWLKQPHPYKESTPCDSVSSYCSSSTGYYGGCGDK